MTANGRTLLAGATAQDLEEWARLADLIAADNSSTTRGLLGLAALARSVAKIARDGGDVPVGVLASLLPEEASRG